jgi:diguanylate cyclase (GGDEF)-like protein
MAPQPATETPVRVLESPAPPPQEPPPQRAERSVQDFERRLEDVVSAIQELAALRFDARAHVGPDGDIIDAVAAGVNFLGEELEASFNEIERRVTDRTAELSLATRELSRQALHDELTGLPNRALFWEHLSHRLKMTERRKAIFAVLFLDVDDFKLVNDTLGHAVGDQLLVDVASRLSAVLRAGDTAARVGGDEFVVLFDEVASAKAALGVAERLNEALRAPYDIGPDRRVVTASIGVAVSRDGLRTADEVVAAADAAMYEAKRLGGGRCVAYSDDLHRPSDRRPPGDSLDRPIIPVEADRRSRPRS